MLEKDGVFQEKIRSMFQVSLGFIGSTIWESMEHVGLGVVDSERMGGERENVLQIGNEHQA